jgi:aspartyl-tRNA(Asn)/glutamyl-tRNA(Gln) amidotransferase subunit A
MNDELVEDSREARGTPVRSSEEISGSESDAYAFRPVEPRRGPTGHVDGLALQDMAIAVKDNIDVAGWPTRAGSPALDDEPAQSDAEVVRRLLAAGAEISAKTALDEFAFTTFGPGMGNPLDRELSVGGSSGGSALAVAEADFLAAIGTDTGGSVRIPASYCGVIGYKPSFGVVPTAGVTPLSWSFDHVGLFAASAAVASRVFGVMRGRAVSSPRAGHAAAEESCLDGLRVGIPEPDYLSAAVPEVMAALGDLRRVMSGSGCVMSTVQLPHVRAVLPSHFVVVLAEAAAYHSGRFSSFAKHGVAVQSFIDAGLKLSATEYVTAVRELARVKEDVEAIFRNVDILILPTTPTLPPARASESVTLGHGEEVDKLTASLWYTSLFNNTGLPAISLPAPGSRLPIGVQLVAAHSQDDLLLEVASAVEEAWAGLK